MEKENNPGQQEEPKRKIDILKTTLNAPSVQQQFSNVLKDNAEAFIAGIIDLYNSDTYLQNCDPKLVVGEALKAAVLKLPLNKALGFSYLVPYKNKQGEFIPTFQIGYKGLIQLAMRTGQYRIINADVVYEGELKRRDKLTGEIDFTGERSSENIEGYFAHIEMLNGFSKTLYMTKQQVTDHAKKYSASYNYSQSAWKTNFDEMALKTVLRNLLSHYGFLSVEMMGVIDKDISQDTKEDRDESVKALTGSQSVKVDDAVFEDIRSKKGSESENSGNHSNKSNDNPQSKPGF